MKTKLDEMVDWLREEKRSKESCLSDDSPFIDGIIYALNKARYTWDEVQEIMKKEKPTADKGLVEEINVFINELEESIGRMERHCVDIHGQAIRRGVVQVLEKILSRYLPTESLAELADRKGETIKAIECDHNKKRDAWFICLVWSKGGSYSNMPFLGDTYAEAESKARSYLDSLPDKKEDGK